MDDFVIKYSIQLIGWPALLGSPHSPWGLKRISDLRLLYAALESGECRWEKMSSGEVTEYAQDIADRRAAGETIGKARKERSDKGGTHQRSIHQEEDEDDSDEENQPPRKKARATAAKPKAVAARSSTKGNGNEGGKRKARKVPCSQPVIENSDEEAGSS